MKIIFADNFIIELKKVPENIKEILKNEIREHITYDNDCLQYNILIEFTNKINYNGEIKFVNSIDPNSGFNKNNFYLIHSNKSMEIPNYPKREKIVVENGFDPKVFFDFFEFLYMQKILEKDMTFLHSSGITVNNKTVLFPAYAGTGKTLVMIQMLKQYNANFIGDDWTIITKEGNVYPYYRKLHLGWKQIMEHRDVLKKYYPMIIPWLIFEDAGGKYNGNNTLLKIFRYIYHRYFIKNQPVYIGPREINSTNVIDYSKLKKVDYIIFISRSSLKNLNYELISADTLTENMVCVTLFENELKPGYDNLSIFAHHYNYKLRQQQIEKQRSIMYSCFKKTKNIWLEVPINASSKEICDFLMKEVLK